MARTKKEQESPEVENVTPEVKVETEQATEQEAPVTSAEKPVEKEIVEEAKVSPPEPVKISDDAPIEDKIIAFLVSRSNGAFIRLNDFLKSLYALPKNNESVAWQNQGNMKTLRLALERLANQGAVIFQGTAYQNLGRAYYPDDTTGKTHYHHLGSISIEAKAV